MFSITPIQYQQNCVIPCNEEICFIYQLEINQEIMKKWNSENNYLPFGYFKTPISLYWTPAPQTSSSSSLSSSCDHFLPRDNDCHTVLLNLMLPWSIGTTTSSCLPQNLSPQNYRSSPLPTGGINEIAAPFPPKSSAFDKIIENGFLSIPPFISAIRPTDILSLLHLDIEGPHQVKANEPFSIRLHLSNISSYPMNEVVIYTHNSKPSNPADPFK
jgi:hypothetical protein